MPSSDFRELSERELALLSDEQLVDHMRAARAAGAAVTLTLAVLAHGYLPTIQRRVSLKVPRADVDDVAIDALESAIKSAFDGESVGEFRAWMHRIVSRRVADYWRRQEGKPELVPLLTGNESEDEWGDIPAVEFEGVAVDAERAVDAALRELSEPHQRVIELFVFEDRPGGDVAAETSESEANVHQIASRFRKRVRELLADDDSSGGGP